MMTEGFCVSGSSLTYLVRTTVHA